MTSQIAVRIARVPSSTRIWPEIVFILFSLKFIFIIYSFDCTSAARFRICRDHLLIAGICPVCVFVSVSEWLRFLNQSFDAVSWEYSMFDIRNLMKWAKGNATFAIANTIKCIQYFLGFAATPR